MPPPPPPPPGPVPIPPLNDANPPKQSANDSKTRSALLESIRTGKSLKKSVTNDRSAPIIEGNKSGGPATLNGPRNGTTCGGSVPMGGLFQGGIPKLRPTGSRPGNSGPATGPLIPQIKKPASTAKKWQPPNTNPPASNIKPPSPVMNNCQQPRKWNSVTDDISNRGQAPQPPVQSQKARFGSMNNVAEQNLQNNSRGGSTSPTTIRPGPPLPSKPPALKRQNSSPGPSFNKPPPPTKGPLLINGPPLPPALPKRPANLKRPSSTEVQPSQLSSGVRSSPLPRETSVPNLNQIISRALPAAPTQSREQPPPPPLPTNATRMQPPPPPPVSTLPRPQMGIPPPPPKVPPSVRPPPPPTRNVTDSGTAGSVPPPPPHRVMVNTIVRGQPPPPPVRNTSNRFSTQEDLESRFNFRSISDFPSPETFSGAMKRYPSKNPNVRKRDPPPPPPGER